MEEVVKKVVIDCDPGIDDALALMMAFASDKLDVLALTAVSGNVPVDQTAENALRLAALAGADVEVAAGADSPLEKAAHHAFHVHGENGLGGVILPASGRISSRNAVTLLKDLINKYPDELEIIALGPLTNIALLLIDSPETASQIKKLSIMGGAVKGGNATAYAEFNIFADPHAAALVFDSGIPIDMFGLDVTNRALLLPEEVKHVRDLGGKVLTPIGEMMGFYLNFYQSVGFDGLGMHDPFTVACVIEPELAEMKSMALRVECEDEEHMGQTAVVPGADAFCRAAVELDNERFKDLFMRLMKTYT
jgi:pyrimidine-specific ribonucleoside hydrolase